jgi:hypothetical protein
MPAAAGAATIVAMRIALVAIIALVLTTGCRTKEKYSSSCKRGHSLTPPWSELGLPVAEGRVCESDDQRAEVQYLVKHKPEWEAAYAQALTTAGYAKGRCSDASCTFSKGTDKATVQVIENKTWITVIIRR